MSKRIYEVTLLAGGIDEPSAGDYRCFQGHIELHGQMTRQGDEMVQHVHVLHPKTGVLVLAARMDRVAEIELMQSLGDGQ